MNRALSRATSALGEPESASLLERTILALKTKKLSYVDDPYWDWKGGTQELAVGPVTAAFEADSAAGGDGIRWLHLHERPMLRNVLAELDRDDVFFDVGAHLGLFSCFAANYLTEGRVVAFEPHPPNAEQLLRNLGHNDDDRADVQRFALSNAGGETQFTQADGVSATTTFASDGDGTPVKQVKGDSLVGDLVPRPSVVKIDVEGAEPMVIEGMEETLSRPECRALFCEVHLPAVEEDRPSIEDYGYDVERLLELIDGLGFDVETADRRGEEIHVEARK